MNPVHGIEERLRECACLGEKDTVQLLVQRGVNINSQHKINGWTALHWAACRGHNDIVAYLLSEGAEPTLLTKSGETAAQLSSSEEIKVMLNNAAGVSDIGASPNNSPKTNKTELPITPNYMQNPPFPYSNTTVTETTVSQNGRSTSPPKSIVTVGGDVKELSIQSRTISTQATIVASPHGKSFNPMGKRELLVKVRIANSGEEDFVEVELDRFNLTYESLFDRCCEELDLSKSAVKKIRKLPNILIRKDKDLQRLTDNQELEVVLLNRLQPNALDVSYY
ncbi:Ankyrin repeat domain-containing protein 40 [Trichoplax sp. H2]|nr:Ankyrin repeat domain-containing protein 40 [Trichoplax sp. H2]|eukprot:RDD40750.1 Ankyrin repeat domain-containing protein 40 [Trichoplax sp. H2]